MAFDFPSSPTEGAVYTPAGGPTYTYTSGIWRVLPPAGNALSTANVSDTPPPNPVQGQVWWKSDTGETFIWYVDANSAQWVQQSDASLPDAPSDTANYLRRDGAWVSQGVQGYRALARVKPTVALSVPVVIAIPSDVTALRITGSVVATATSYCLMQASSNGGSTWEGAGMYALAQLYYAGAAGGQAVSTDWIFLSGSSNAAGIYRNTVNCHYTLADGTNRGVAISHTGSWSSAAQVLVGYTITGTAAKTNAVRILMGAGNIGVGTDILVEAL